jgi:hypothetical protein
MEVENLKFNDLWVGDRFTSGGRLWTKIAPDVARHHSSACLLLGERSYGYIGDHVCSFERDDPVAFVPVAP